MSGFHIYMLYLRKQAVLGFGLRAIGKYISSGYSASGPHFLCTSCGLFTQEAHGISLYLLWGSNICQPTGFVVYFLWGSM